MDKALEREVRRRAAGRCEYCLISEEFDATPFQIDHIIARKHGGETASGNLAMSCFWCNSFKGSNIASRDRTTHLLTPLFNPRRNSWPRHFRWQGPYLVGRTAVGRVTIAILKINDPLRVEFRRHLMVEHLFP